MATLRTACLLLAALAAPAVAAGQTVTMHRAGQDLRIAVGDAAVLPADFPPDVPLPSTYTVVRVEHSDGSTTITVATPGTIDDEATRFRAGMLAAGWTAAALVPPRTGLGQAWVKDKRAVLAWLAPADAGGMHLQLRLLAQH